MAHGARPVPLWTPRKAAAAGFALQAVFSLTALAAPATGPSASTAEAASSLPANSSIGAASALGDTGEWSAPFPFPTIPIHATLLPTGKVLFWDRHDFPTGDGHPRLWDPVTGLFAKAALPPPGHDLFCSAHVLLEDGRLFVAGGHYSDGIGQPFAATYDPFAGTWSLLPEMNAGRWYPTATLLADGSVLVMGGSNESGGSNELPQIYRPASFGWLDLTGAPRVLPYYPRVFQAPDGRALVVSPDQNTSRLDPRAPGTWSSFAGTGHGFRSYGSAVVYGEGKVLLAGGGETPTATAQAIDLLQANPAFHEASPMAFARRQHNLTLLPDGSVLATGGTAAGGFNNVTGAVLAAELWDPVTEGWTTLASAAVPRLYHSVALLLPDGRVLSAGGGHPSDGEHGDPDHFDGEIFSPPYLFRGVRPTIVLAPDSVGLGDLLPITFGPEAPVAAVTWLRLGSATHGFNMNQRFLRLTAAKTAQGTSFLAPADPRLAPPGHYLMFALTADGIPSLGKVIQLRGGLFRDGFESATTLAWSLALP